MSPTQRSAWPAGGQGGAQTRPEVTFFHRPLQPSRVSGEEYCRVWRVEMGAAGIWSSAPCAKSRSLRVCWVGSLWVLP